MSKNTRTRILLTAVAALLLVVMAVGGTLAWLTDVTPPVTNTFTPTNIDVVLGETVPENKTAQVIPGVNIPKDPKVTATATAGVAYYVFIEVTETGWCTAEEENGDRKVEYAIDGAWLELGTINKGATRVYYQADDDGGSFEDYILAGEGNGDFANGQITVSENLTDEEMEQLQTMGTLSFKAYVMQQDAMESKEAAYEIASGHELD